MTLTFKDLYNQITGQAWSMFDGEIENKDEFETTVTTSIQKALADLYFEYEYPFRLLTQKIKTRENKTDYNLPNGSIYKKGSNYCVRCDSEYLDFVTDQYNYEYKTGKPEVFFIKNNKICFYPVPDDIYIIEVDYLNMMTACNKDGEEQANLKEDDDYVNIDERYEDLFKNALLPLAMMYLIASETDENYSAYRWQYEKALKKLQKYAQGVKQERVIGW